MSELAAIDSCNPASSSSLCLLWCSAICQTQQRDAAPLLLAEVNYLPCLSHLKKPHLPNTACSSYYNYYCKQSYHMLSKPAAQRPCSFQDSISAVTYTILYR